MDGLPVHLGGASCPASTSGRCHRVRVRDYEAYVARLGAGARDVTPPPRRGRKRGNGEGTITRRADGRYTAAIFVIRPDGTRGRKWVYGADPGRGRRASWPGLPNASTPVQWCLPAPRPWRSTSTYWLAEVIMPRRRPTTWRSTAPRSSSTCGPAWASPKLDQLTVATVQRYLNARRAAGDSVAEAGDGSVRCSAPRSAAPARGARDAQRRTADHAADRAPARRPAWTAEQARVFLRAAATTRPTRSSCWRWCTACGAARSPPCAGATSTPNAASSTSAPAWSVSTAGSSCGPTKSAAGVRALPLVDLSPRGAGRRTRRQTEQRAAADARARHRVARDRLRLHHPQRAPGRTAQPLPLVRPHRRRGRTADRSCSTTCAAPPRPCSRDLGVPARDAQMILGHAHVSRDAGRSTARCSTPRSTPRCST